ncbi:MAG TPA: hypothetical protein VFR68_03930 [Candidatus Dormibacteraeota bacterium]|nr:hypothetical protein [Candidatus Dormibacteraeota bacterium]
MPPTLLLKVIVTPALITAATLVGRRWGEAMSGWLVGLPLTSGPVVLFLAIEQGSHFASAAALGVVLGVASQAVFALAYIWLGKSDGWMPRALSGTVAFAIATVVFQLIRMPAAIEPLFVFASLLLAIALMPRGRPREKAVPAPRGDLPLRIIVATALVVGLTTVAPVLGAYLSGLILPFPLYAAILAVFAHRLGGLGAATAVWRGLLFGLFSFLTFFTVIALTLVPLGILAGFVLAIISAMVVQAATLVVLRSEPSRN